MNRQDFYFEQLVTQADLDTAFDFAEQADQRALTDNGYVGVVGGLEVVEASPTPNITVTVNSGVAYDQLGQRCFVPVPTTLNLAVDSNAVSTAVANPGNEKWLSVFIEFDRALSDPRVDGNGVPLLYLRAESFQFVVDQGAENAAGTPATYTSTTTEPFALTNGSTLDVSIDGAAPITVTFLTGDFASIGAATAAEVAAVITAQLGGAATAADVAGAVAITSSSTGPGASLLVTGGSASVVFAFPTIPATGSGGPTRPGLRPDAILLADVLLRFGTTAIVDKPDPGGAAGVIDQTTRRQSVFRFGGTFNITAGTITDFADALADILNSHIGNTGNAHPASAITYTPSGNLIALDVQAALDELEAEKAGLAVANTFTGVTNDFNGRTDLNGGAVVGGFLNVLNAPLNLFPTTYDSTAAWTFTADLGAVSPSTTYGVCQQYTLTGAISSSLTVLYDGGTTPLLTRVGQIRGRLLVWDDNTNPVGAGQVDFTILFSHSAGVSTTVVFDEDLTARAINGGVTDQLAVVVVDAPAGTGTVGIAFSWDANLGAVKNIAAVWTIEEFGTNQ